MKYLYEHYLLCCMLCLGLPNKRQRKGARGTGEFQDSESFFPLHFFVTAQLGFAGARPQEQNQKIGSVRTAMEKYCQEGFGKYCHSSWEESLQSCKCKTGSTALNGSCRVRN